MTLRLVVKTPTRFRCACGWTAFLPVGSYSHDCGLDKDGEVPKP